MNVTVVNGSPKGEYSTTLQTTRYLEILFPEDTFTVLDVGKRIRYYETHMEEAVSALCSADLVIFSYPVYTFIATSQLHRFIELLKERGADLVGKPVTQITTSKHFYDITAHRYVEDNCHDMGLKVIRGLSADMDDLTKEAGQKDAENFYRYVKWCVENKVYEPDKPETSAFLPKGVSAAEPVEKKNGRVVIVADLPEEESSLGRMIDRFWAKIPFDTEVVNIREFPFKGGCISCFHCAPDGKCIYTDGFDSFLREKIQTADATVTAFSIKDHSMGSRFKMFDDRQFCNGHRTVTMGKPVGYLVDGAYSAEENLRMIIEGRAQVGGNYLCGVATNEFCPDDEIDAMAARLTYAIEHQYTQPSNFLGVGGMKIFRDLIWLMQGMMKADHRFYKAHGQYDFPQKKWGTMLAMYLVGGMMSNPKVMAKMGSKMNEGMLMSYKKVLDKARKERNG